MYVIEFFLNGTRRFLVYEKRLVKAMNTISEILSDDGWKEFKRTYLNVDFAFLSFKKENQIITYSVKRTLQK